MGGGLVRRGRESVGKSSTRTTPETLQDVTPASLTIQKGKVRSYPECNWGSHLEQQPLSRVTVPGAPVRHVDRHIPRGNPRHLHRNARTPGAGSVTRVGHRNRQPKLAVVPRGVGLHLELCPPVRERDLVRKRTRVAPRAVRTADDKAPPRDLVPRNRAGVYGGV